MRETGSGGASAHDSRVRVGGARQRGDIEDGRRLVAAAVVVVRVHERRGRRRAELRALERRGRREVDRLAADGLRKRGVRGERAEQAGSGQRGERLTSKQPYGTQDGLSTGAGQSRVMQDEGRSGEGVADGKGISLDVDDAISAADEDERTGIGPTRA